MVSFGDSKHKPVEPLQSLLDITPLKLAISAKCTIHDVVPSYFFISFHQLRPLHTKNPRIATPPLKSHPQILSSTFFP